MHGLLFWYGSNNIIQKLEDVFVGVVKVSFPPWWLWFFAIHCNEKINLWALAQDPPYKKCHHPGDDCILGRAFTKHGLHTVMVIYNQTKSENRCAE